MLSQPPNWVAERAKCRIDLLFDALCQIVERDVTEFNQLPSSLRRGCTFTAACGDEGTTPVLRVYHVIDNESQAVASFTPLRQGINIWVIDKGWQLAFPEWVEQTQSCLLSFDGERSKIWELSQRVLGPLFFEHRHTKDRCEG